MWNLGARHYSYRDKTIPGETAQRREPEDIIKALHSV
jgi:hypothetical protein